MGVLIVIQQHHHLTLLDNDAKGGGERLGHILFLVWLFKVSISWECYFFLTRQCIIIIIIIFISSHLIQGRWVKFILFLLQRLSFLCTLSSDTRIVINEKSHTFLHTHVFSFYQLRIITHFSSLCNSYEADIYF